MNNIFLRKDAFWLPSLAIVAIVGTSLSAHAQIATPLSSNQPNAEIETQNQNLSVNTTGLQQFPGVTQDTTNRIITPVPGTVATTSTILTSGSEQPTAQVPSTTTVAQSNIDLGRPTRGGRSYLGVGGNIGLSGSESSLSDGNFAIISKIGITNTFSVRPSAIFGNNTTILIPVTYDFTLKAGDAFSEPLAIAPYIGVGAAIKTGDDSKTAFLVTGGIDVPLNAQFTATAAVNAGFFNKTDVGLLFGVGYNFSGF